MSESNKFTPGPWEHKKDGDGEWRVRQKGSVKKVLGGTTERPVCEVVNTIADARLIAAAPDLLEALSELYECFDELNHPQWDKSPTQIKAMIAINKARNQQ